MAQNPPRHRVDAFPRRSRPSGNGRAPGSWPSATRTARPAALLRVGLRLQAAPAQCARGEVRAGRVGRRGRARARPALASVPALPSQALAVVMTKGPAPWMYPCVAGPDLRETLRRTSAKHVVVAFRGNVAPCLSSLRNELATRSGPLYAGASPLRNVPLPASLEERTKLRRRARALYGVAVLSSELASYVAFQATPPLLSGTVARGFGVWLAPFDY